MSEILLINEDIEATQSETSVCHKCGAEYIIDEMNEFDEKFLCDECYNEYTVACEHCGDRLWLNDSYSDEDIYLCHYCYDSHYYRCYDCEQLVDQNDTMYYNDNHYCQSCYDELDRDEDNDDYCDSSSYRDKAIRSYNYKPYPIFYGEGIHYGVELEVDEAGENSYNAETILGIGNYHNDHIYIKHDGSLSRGFEIVSHPMTLGYHQNKMNWCEIMDKLVNMGYLSHKAATCGLHLHVERAKLGCNIEQQEETISNILYFVERHWHELLRFSRRTQSQIQRWASRYGYKDSPKDILNCAKSGNWGRYVCVNLQNYNTIELRMFRGTLKYSTFIATLQIVEEICNVALSLSEEELKALTWSDFVSNIDKSERPELIEYLKFKNLYVNEPYDGQEDI